MPSASPRFQWKGFLLLCGIFVLVAGLWHTEFVLPLKLLVVLLHEVSHGVAALATGGGVAEMQIRLDQGGHCVTTGGVPFVVASAGYLGSLVFGVTLLLVATRTRFAPLVSALLGALLVLIAVRYMHDWRGFGRWFALLTGLIFAGVALFPPMVSGFVLRLIGVTSCLYVFLDIKHDVLDQDHAASDATQLAAITGVPAVVWGIAWIGVSVVVTVLAMKWAVTGAPPAPRATGSGTGAKSARS